MSEEAIEWAGSRTGLDIDERRVLMALALQADENGETQSLTMAWISAMALICQMTPDRVLLVIGSLSRSNLVSDGTPLSFRVMIGA